MSEECCFISEKYLYSMFSNAFADVYANFRESVVKQMAKYLCLAICLRLIKDYFETKIYTDGDLTRKYCVELGASVSKYEEILDKGKIIKASEPSTRYTRLRESRFRAVPKRYGYYFFPRFKEEYFVFSIINASYDPLRVNIKNRKKYSLTYESMSESYRLFNSLVNLGGCNNKNISYYLFERDYGFALLLETSLSLVENGIDSIGDTEVDNLVSKLVELERIPDIGIRQVLIGMIFMTVDELISDVCKCVTSGSYSNTKRNLYKKWGKGIESFDFEQIDELIGDFWHEQMNSRVSHREATRKLLKKYKMEIIKLVMPYWLDIISDYINGFAKFIQFAENYMHLAVEETFGAEKYSIIGSFLYEGMSFKNNIYSNYAKSIEAKEKRMNKLSGYYQQKLNEVFVKAAEYLHKHDANIYDSDKSISKILIESEQEEIKDRLLAQLMKAQKL